MGKHENGIKHKILVLKIVDIVVYINIWFKNSCYFNSIIKVAK